MARSTARRGTLGRALILVSSAALFLGCNPTAGSYDQEDPPPGSGLGAPLSPRVVTDSVRHDTDDPAIWIHPTDPSRSLILGTDKDADGALFVYDLNGRTVETVDGLQRPNNVDVAYGLMLGGAPTDVAVITERYTSGLRIFALPDLRAVDNGGIEIFQGEEERAPMGIALYERPSDGAVFAIVSRKEGPAEDYLWQYRLEDDGSGNVAATKVRAFGDFSGKAEIEAVAVDDALGYVYYSDETHGVRKYHADPDAPGADEELGVFATEGFEGDNEGISIYETGDSTGYIVVSDQQDTNEFHVYRRKGTPDDPHHHELLTVVTTSAEDTDGIEVTSAALGEQFPGGLLVAMSSDRTFHFYAWADFARALKASTARTADNER